MSTFYTCGDCFAKMKEQGAELDADVSEITLGRQCETHARFFPRHAEAGYEARATNAVRAPDRLELPTPPEPDALVLPPNLPVGLVTGIAAQLLAAWTAQGESRTLNDALIAQASVTATKLVAMTGGK